MSVATSEKSSIEFMKPERFRCAEASSLSKDTYIPCGNQATAFVKSRDRMPYPMCSMCADHNVTNRGANKVQLPCGSDVADIEYVTKRSGTTTAEQVTAIVERQPAKESYIAFSVTEETVKAMTEKHRLISNER